MATNTPVPGRDEMEPPSVTHQAIDQLSAALMKVQLLGRKYAEHEGLPGALDEIVVHLQRLGNLLHQLQEPPEEARH